MEEYGIIKKSDKPKVIAMLSGGKDSIASIVLLKKNGIDVTAIHFVHNWSSEIPTEEAKRICKEYSIPLIIKNFTWEFCNSINGYAAGRPCLLCKKQMYKSLLKYLLTGEYGWLCIGDNSNDRTTIARIKQFINNGHSEDTLICNGYFGSEMGIKLPINMKVIRPLINMSVEDVEKFLNDEGIIVKRINSTGDKYFDYHREGCPIQFVDIGVKLNEKLYYDLKKYNDCITKFAREKKILASIHMPSTFIVTIPRGYEIQAANYLEMQGLTIDRNINDVYVSNRNVLICHIYDLNRQLFIGYKKIFNRFLERLELYGTNKFIHEVDNIIVCSYKEDEVSLSMILNFKEYEADIRYSFSEKANSRKSKLFFDNLILEVFRTRKYNVININ